MSNHKRFVTTCGAVAFLLSSALSPMQACLADTSARLGSFSFPVVAEEVYGAHKYQVARVQINASPTQVQEILTDYERTTKMFNGVKSCKVLSSEGANKKIAFVAEAPGNLWTFNYVLAVHESPGYIEWRRDSGSFKSNEGFWKLESTDGGHSTLVTYAKYVDAGLIPQPLVVHELRISMPQILTNLKENSELHLATAEAARKTD